MPKNAIQIPPSTPEQREWVAIPSVKSKKFEVFLVTGDETLWPQVGAELSAAMLLKQVDSVDELIGSTPSGQAGIVLWDAVKHRDPAAALSRISLHSARFAIVALDLEANAERWSLATQQRQVVGYVALPMTGDAFKDTLDSAREEVNARMALLGDPAAAGSRSADSARRSWMVAVGVSAIVVAGCAAFYLITRGGSDPPKVVDAAAPPSSEPLKMDLNQPAGVKGFSEADERIGALVDKAQQAMLDRHFIDPAAGSALSLYREVLAIDPANGEAHQGLARLTEILLARVQSASDDRKFDAALQSLETARSISPGDPRLAAFDDKILSMRAELAPAQIVATMNAQNFDRATQLIEEAAHSKTIAPGRLVQLRDELRRRRNELEIGRLIQLIDLRIQQDHLIDPRSDSAAFYLDQAKQAGAGVATLQTQVQEFIKHLGASIRGAIEAKHFSDADKLLSEMHARGAPPAYLAMLIHDLSVARAQQSAQQSDQPKYLDLAAARIAQGKLIDPDNDNALYYVNLLRSADPRNPGLAQISAALQLQLLDRAHAAFDAGDLDKSQGWAQSATTLGPSVEADSLGERIRQKRAAARGLQQVPEQNLTRAGKLEVQYPLGAMQAGVEGWVEIAYTVLADGSVADVKIAASSPPKVFDAAASKAVGHLRYRPVLQNGSPVAVGTMVRVVFRVPK